MNRKFRVFSVYQEGKYPSAFDPYMFKEIGGLEFEYIGDAEKELEKHVGWGKEYVILEIYSGGESYDR